MLRQPEKLHISVAFHRVKKRMPGKVTGGTARSRQGYAFAAQAQFRQFGNTPAARACSRHP